MTRRRYTDEDRQAALRVYVDVGLAEASRQTGVPKATLKDWGTKAGIQDGHVRVKTREQTAATLERIKADGIRLAADLMGDCDRLRRQLWEPTVERKAMVVSGGPGAGSAIDIVDIDRDRPTFAEQTKIMTTVAIAVDKVQLLTGQATERTEHRTVGSALDQEIEAEIARMAAEMADRPATAPVMADAELA